MSAVDLVVIIVVVIAGWWYGLKLIGGWPRERQVHILGVEGMTPEQVRQEIERGGRFVQFVVAVSIFLVIWGYWRRSKSDIHFLKAGEPTTPLLLRYTVGMALLLPLGPFIAVALLMGDNRDKKTNVTYQVMRQLPPAGGVNSEAAKAAAEMGEMFEKFMREKSARKD